MLNTQIKFIAVLLALFVLSACQNEDVAVKQTAGLVLATQAYVQYFGEPPQGKKGMAFARVAYLPLKDRPDMIRAFPVYLFSEGYHLPKILERITSKELLLPENSDLFKPFPDDLGVVAEPPADGLQKVLLTTRQSWSVDDQAATGIAMAETALQFSDIARVEISVNGAPLASMPVGGFVHNPKRLAELEPPDLVLIAAAWEEGEENPAELMVEFDRPVKVNTFELLGPRGEKVEGDYYTSIFQMAVIVHPEKPGLFKEGVQMHAEWDVVDTLGRKGRGSRTLPLHRYDH